MHKFMNHYVLQTFIRSLDELKVQQNSVVSGVAASPACAHISDVAVSNPDSNSGAVQVNQAVQCKFEFQPVPIIKDLAAFFERGIFRNIHPDRVRKLLDSWPAVFVNNSKHELIPPKITGLSGDIFASGLSGLCKKFLLCLQNRRHVLTHKGFHVVKCHACGCADSDIAVRGLYADICVLLAGSACQADGQSVNSKDYLLIHVSHIPAGSALFQKSL